METIDSNIDSMIDSITVQQLQENIHLIEDLLEQNGPNYVDRPFYMQMLEEQYSELAGLQGGQAATRTLFPDSYIYRETPHLARPISPASSSSASRKRSVGQNATYPDSKRPSMNPSPITPNTPNSVNADFSGYGSSMAGPSRQTQPYASNSNSAHSHPQRYHQQTLPYTPSRPVPPSNVIDLTESNPPTPDPFLELNNAFTGGPEPLGAFQQDYMPDDELAQFMMAPTPANQSHAFQGFSIPQHSVTHPAYGVYEAPEVPLYMGSADKPWAPSDNEAEYGAPLSYNEAQAMENLLGNVSAHDAEDAPERREQTPRIMCSELKEYQKIGLTWLIKMEIGTNKGGILADGMGLGKTVQAISLICARPSDDPSCKTTLIIAPLALIRQWEKEIARHVKPEYRLKVHVYHGTGKNKDFAQLRQYDVVLTTFGILTNEFKKKDRKESMKHQEEERTGISRKAKDKLALLGRECMWYRVIIDEAQCIKNRQTVSSKAAHDLVATHRLVMTGTPMMNAIDELYPLIRFLDIAPYHDWPKFNSAFSKPLRNPNAPTRKAAMQRVQVLLKSIMLRRQKDSIVDGQIVTKLPPKHLSKDEVKFSDEEMAIYKALETKSQIQLNKYLEKGTLSANYANVLVLLLRLRQACCHPHLIKDLSQPATEHISEDDLLSRARDLQIDVVLRILAADSFDCPCRGDLKAERITDYKHFCRVHAPEKLDPADRTASEEPDSDVDSNSDSDSDSEDEDEVEASADDVDEKGNLADFVVDDGAESEYEAEESDNVDEAAQENSAAKTKEQKKKKKRSKGKGKAKAKSSTKVSLAQLKKDSMRNKAAKEKYLRRLRKNWITSAKIEKTMDIIDEIGARDPTEKILIFSQWTSLLDLLEVPMLERHVRYQRYDGSMTVGDRADALDRFMDRPDERVLLLSLKAGNAGLNLANANHVILLDPFWNPYVEEQAIDRAHRMPQHREVTVHRVLVPETVEDRICEIQDKKREMIDTALDEKSSKSLTRLGARELRFIFGMGA
ncbi:hypothetical protein E8E13_002570 [Curvularia kusanoi]|uniref:Uncharacterized protein n=1 Tax=Curvularia kusanoi TaxID=90978 RepID=A0A9P4TDS8_CURKU|nr:hypothetical protein E8E13_002570 [Curvularia kusanoi]